MNEDVSLFNLELPTLVSLPDNDMIDENIDYILLQINMSVPPENPESRRCILVAFGCLHVYIFTNVLQIMSHAIKMTNIY